MENNNTNKVASVKEYNARMQEGLNSFLDHAEGEMVQNNNADYEDGSLTLTIVDEGKDPSDIVESEVENLSFEDCSGVFEFVVMDNTHFKFNILEEPNWSDVKMSEHIGEAVSFIIQSRE